jgi:hypothetical protein
MISLSNCIVIFLSSRYHQDGKRPDPAGRDPWLVAEAESALASTSSGGGSSGNFKGRKEGDRGRAGQEALEAMPEDGLTIFPEMELVVEAESDVDEDGAEDPQVQR